MTVFDPQGSAIIVGASGGLGAALTDAIVTSGRFAEVHAMSRTGRAAPWGAVASPIDVTHEASVAEAMARPVAAPRLVIVASGLLHAPGISPEKALKALDPAAMAHLFAVNTIGPALVAKHALPRFARDDRAVFAALSARVGSISDNRLGGWHGYRASKAALNMLIATMAIELARTRPLALCVGLHPGTVDTGLSRPFQGGVSPERPFSPAESAAHLLRTLDGLTAADSGGVFAWDGSRIPA